MKLISVIIPAHNPAAAHLLPCLDSVFAQTHANIEVILVDDGSTDTAVFDGLAGQYPALSLLRLQPNRGPAFARNHGVAHAQGEYLTFMDSDDLWVPEKLTVQAAYLDANPECAYITSRQRYFLSEGVTKPPGWVKEEHIGVSLPGFLPGTLMVRKEVFDASGGFDPKLKAGTDDVDWFFRANTVGLKTAELPQVLQLKRIHGANITSHVPVHNKELLSVVRSNLQRRKSPVSVIIPCYNGKNYIREALETVLAEGDLIGEIVVVDDASTDGSAEYVAGLNVPKVTLHRLPQNKGIGGARNAGIAFATCAHLAFLDADDLWVKGRTQLLLEAMRETPWAFGGIEHFLSPDSADARYALPPVQTGYFASAMIVRADFFHRVGLFDETLKVGEFIDWYHRAQHQGVAPAVVPSVVLRRRIHGSNSSIVSGNKNVADYLKVARRAIQRGKQQ